MTIRKIGVISDFAVEANPKRTELFLVNRANRVFIISLDGATWTVLKPLINQGYMPNLGRLVEESLSSELDSIIPPITAPAWTSFMTGKEPSKHGIFGFTRFDFSDYRTKLNNAQDIRSKTIWQLLSERDKRVVVLQLPYTYPPYEINGVMVSGWDAPSTEVTFTHPPELAKEILRLIPDYESSLHLSLWNYIAAESEEQYNDFVDRLVRAFEQGVELAVHFLEQEPHWDVFMVHFQQTDFIQHKLWNYIEAACEDPQNRSNRVQKIRECYRKYDELVGVLLKKLETIDCIRIVLSDHGFGDYKGAICPNHYLLQWGYLETLVEKTDSLRAVKNFFKKSRHRPLQKLYEVAFQTKERLVSRRMGKKYRSWAVYAQDTLPQDDLPIDWKRTKAAALLANQIAFIYVNLIGRGPAGIVPPGEEHERLIEELISRFREIRHPLTGGQLLSKVVRGQDVYSPPAEGVIVPDIILDPVPGYGFSTSFSDSPPAPNTTGVHRMNGILIVADRGALCRSKQHFQPRLIDVAPTILHMLGLPVPSDMDGRVLEEIFLHPQQVCYREVDNSLKVRSKGYGEDESRIIEERLRGLGYIE